MTDVLDRFKAFLEDEDAPRCFITGPAGTGKTTCLGELVQHCMDEDLPAATCAFTHRACEVLRSKLPKRAVVRTLHSFLKKRPTINDRALKVQHVDKNTQTGVPDAVRVLFIDEFSMVGDRDFVSINDLQYDEDGGLVVKVVYIGDPNQLPPVKDARAIVPAGKHWIRLTKVHRQAHDNPLLDTLICLNDYIDGKDPEPLAEHATFRRGVDVEVAYRDSDASKVLLAYTNERVQSLNASIQGYDVPKVYDGLFSPTTRRPYLLSAIDDEALAIVNVKGEIVELGSKYKTLETLLEMPEIRYYTVEDEDAGSMQVAGVFGHSDYLVFQQSLAKRAVKCNNDIKHAFKVDDATVWAKANYGHELARKRSGAWRRYLAFKDNVLCLDFKHAMTVHKSQGSTYEEVFLDVEDMAKCAKNDYELYLKLMYVAISRASRRVYTN